MAFKDLTDACMSLLNTSRIDDVFINDGYVEVKALNDKNRIRNSRQLAKELKDTLFLTSSSNVKVEHISPRNNYRFWSISLEEYLCNKLEKLGIFI